MTGQGRVLLFLAGGVVLAAGALLWLALQEEEGGGDAAAQTAAADAAGRKPDAAPAATPPRRAGNCAIFGDIKRSAGQAPVEGQSVALTPTRGEPWRVVTDAQGVFRFEKLPHGGPYELSAAAPGCGTVRVPGIALDRNEQRNVGTLYLDPAVRVTVRVRTHLDEPVEGALVEAFPIVYATDWDWTKALAQLGQAPIAVAKGTTDASGEVVFPELSVGRWTFAASKPGLAGGGSKGQNVRAGDDAKPVTIHLGPGHGLEGRVLTQERAPVANALVLAGPPNTQWDVASAPLRQRVRTDAEGRYGFRSLESGDVQLYVALGDEPPSPASTVRVPFVPRFDIVLEGTGTLSGLVTEEGSGKPVEGATVRATSWMSNQARVGQATTDAEGRYSLAMTEGVVNQLAVEKSGLVQVQDEQGFGMQRAAVVVAGETTTKDLRMRTGARLTGTVKGPAGPLAGARVVVYSGSPQRGYQQKTATSDASGKYEFPSLDTGTVMVTATKAGLYQEGVPTNWWEAMQQADSAKEHKIEVPASGDATKDVEMKAGSVVEGVVLGPDGAPLAGVKVAGPNAEEGAPTGEDGAFKVVGVTPGPTVTLWPSKEGYQRATSPALAVVAGEPTTGVTLRMVRQARVRGTVTTSDGTPATEVRVLLATRNRNPQPWEQQQVWTNAVRVAVHADGTFDAPVPWSQPNILLVRATALDRQSADAAPVELVEGTESYEVNLTLAPGAAIAGRAIVKGTGAPVAGARVSITPAVSGNQAVYYGGTPFTVWAVSDDAGAFRIENVAPGNYDVRAVAQGFVAAQTAAEPGAAEAKLELAPERTIEGVVVYPDGKPVEGAEVQANDARTQGTVMYGYFGPDQRTALTSRTGSFRIPGVGDGTWSLDVRAPWGSQVAIQAKRVEGVAGGARDVKIVVEPGGTISGRVLDANRKPIASAWVSANPVRKPGVAVSGNEWRNAQTGADGAFVLTGLGEGPYAVNVNAQTGRSGGYRPASLEKVAVGTKELEVLLEEGLGISGVLVDGAGQPISQCSVQAQPAERQEGPVQGGNGYTDHEGKFMIAGLRPGAYRLEIPQWGGGNQGWVLQPTQPVAAGTKDVRLVGTKGVSITGVLVDETGKPVSDGWVNATAKSGGQGRYANPTPAGTFEIVGLEAGQTYRIHAQTTGRVPVMLEDVAAGTKDLRIVLAKGLEASGRLVDAAGKPVASTWIYFQIKGAGSMQHAQTGADGKFVAGGLVEGTYDVSVYVPSADGKSHEQKPLGQIRGGDRDVEFRMP